MVLLLWEAVQRVLIKLNIFLSDSLALASLVFTKKR